MCGRFTLTTTDTQKLKDTFDISDVRVDDIQPRYNIAPTQNILTVVADSDDQRYLGAMRWGFIPSWHKDESKLSGFINARSETAAEKPTFRSAFTKRRCLVVADGFYEWQKQDEGSKVPMYIHLSQHGPFGMAGLWERYQNPATGEVWVTCTILTTAANGFMKPIHERMPVIMPESHYAEWLDPDNQDKERLQEMLKPAPEDWLVAYPVSTGVNNVRNDDPSLIERVDYSA
ncbi:MAG: SOS response-associated peptidase [Chloroflexi bacterium]|nr:SOS response-associated peptidase [Chloroflexota bacterium]